MAGFIEGQDRTQVTLLPECLDDFVDEDNPVRVIDAFVAGLELGALGFGGVSPKSTGRPGYDPAVLLKIYIYGYLNRIQSSRRLERECQRNLELMWLTGRLAPDFKTIADFRRDNGKGIRGVCTRFVQLCREIRLLSSTTVAIDGSKFKAVNSRDRNFTQGKIDKRREQIEQSIERYMQALEAADRTPAPELQARAQGLPEKIKLLKRRMKALGKIEQQLAQEPDAQISLTDPDSRSMATRGKGSGVVGYNVQLAVEAKHHLIVAHEVSNEGHDRGQLSVMAVAARDAMSRKRLQVLADRGYYNAVQIKACEDEGIAASVPRPMTSIAKYEGRFDKSEFIYIARTDEYRCPAGQRAIFRFAREEGGLMIRRYWSSACPQCPMKDKCTPSDYRRISRWEHAAVLDVAQRRLDRHPQAMTVRRSTVEHVFGTLKHWMGSTHFLTRRLAHVGTEISLNVLAYNLKRVMNILGVAKTLRAVTAKGC